MEDEARRDRDALALPSRELVRIAVDVELRRREARELERALDLLAPLLLRADAVHLERLLDRRADAEARVERLVRVLVDDLHPAAEGPEILGREPRDLLTVEADRAAARLDQAQNRLRRGRLPAARLSDEGEHLATVESEGDAVDGMHLELRLALRRADQPPPDRVAGDQVLDLEQRLGAVRAHAVAGSRT